jgi:hypothetical protein
MMMHKNTFLLVFFMLNLLISSFYIDTWKNANTTSRALPIITYFEDGTFRFDKYHELTCDKSLIDGHYYTDKAPLPTYVVLPFFGVMVKLGIITPDTNGNLLGDHIFILGGFLTGSIPYVCIMLLVFIAIKNLNTTISPILLSILPFYASFIYVFTGTFFPHILSGLLMLIAYIYLKKDNHLFAGIFAGLSFLCEYNLAVFFFLWVLQLIGRKKAFKPAVIYCLGILPSLLFILYYNYVFTGSPFVMLYKYHNFDQLNSNYGFTIPEFKSLWGLSFSWYKGLFYYTPFLILIFIMAFIPVLKKGGKFILTNYLILPSFLYYLFIASYFGWWGGWTHGPRFLLSMSILLIYEGILFLSDKKFSKVFFWILIGFGLISNILAKVTFVYSIPTDMTNPLIDFIIPGFLNGELNPNNLLTIFVGTKPLTAFIVYLILFSSGLLFLNHWYNSLTKKYS